MTMVSVHNLVIAFGGHIAVRDISFVVPAGEALGLIGPNGAGKSSTMKAMATLVRPSRGRVMIDGINATAEPMRVRGRIGWVPDYFGVYEGLTARDYLRFFAAVNKLDPRKRDSLVRDVLALTDLTGKADSLVDGLSRGMKQRLSIARTLLHDPDLLLLDEPTEGLDPRARIEMRELLLELQRMGKTMVISSHLLHELSQLCTRVCILEAGKLVAEGPLDRLCQDMGLRRLVHLQIVEETDAVMAAIAAIPGVQSLERQGDRLALQFVEGEAGMDDLHEAVVATGARIRMFQPEAVDMEAVFMALTKGKTA